MSQHTIWYGPKAKARGYKPSTWTIQQLIAALGTEFTVFESFGHVNGVEGFSRVTGQVEDGVFVARNSEGTVVSRYALDRKLRILTT